MSEVLTRLKIDPYILILIATVALASLLPRLAARRLRCSDGPPTWG